MKYVLRNKDKDVLSFEFKKELFKNNEIDVFDNLIILDKKLVPINFYKIEDWIKTRRVPKK